MKKQIILHSRQIIWHRLFWTECLCLVTRQILEHVLDPRWRFVDSHFSTAILPLFQTFIFETELPKLVIGTVIVLLSVILKEKGLILPDLAFNWQNIQAHVPRDQFYLDTTNECTNVNVLQPRQLTCLWNKTDSLSIRSFRKQCILCW